MEVWGAVRSGADRICRCVVRERQKSRATPRSVEGWSCHCLKWGRIRGRPGRREDEDLDSDMTNLNLWLGISMEILRHQLDIRVWGSMWRFWGEIKSSVFSIHMLFKNLETGWTPQESGYGQSRSLSTETWHLLTLKGWGDKGSSKEGRVGEEGGGQEDTHKEGVISCVRAVENSCKTRTRRCP